MRYLDAVLIFITYENAAAEINRIAMTPSYINMKMYLRFSFLLNGYLIVETTSRFRPIERIISKKIEA